MTNQATIKDFCSRFDNVRADIESSSAKFSQIQMDIDQRQNQKLLLETEVSTMQINEQKKSKTAYDIEQQKKALLDNIKTLEKMESAFKQKLNALK